MTIDLKMSDENGNINYQMNFDTVLSAVTYGDEMNCDYQVMVSYYDAKQDQDVTKVVIQSGNW